MVAINEISTSIGEREALRGRGELCVETPVFTAPDSTGNRWGDAAVQSTFGGNSIIYCGYSYNPETENYYVRNRYYSPSLGRWITRDPIGISGGINLYGYVGSSPVGMMDPSGFAQQAPHLHVLTKSEYDLVADDIEEDLQVASKHRGIHGWKKYGAAKYVPYVLRFASALHFVEIGAAEGALKIAFRLATLIAADNPVGWATGVLGFTGKQAIKIAIKLAALKLAQIRASGQAIETYRAFFQVKKDNGWNTAAILIRYDPFTGKFSGAISGSVGQIQGVGKPNGIGCIHKFSFPFDCTVNKDDRVPNANFHYDGQ